MATKPQPAFYYDENEVPLPPKQLLPTMYDLPDEEVGQPGMPDTFHIWQAQLLSETFQPPDYEPSEICTASDLNVYYDVHNLSRNKRPDWFAVVGLPKTESQPPMRLSYVMWQEGVSPLVVMEFLSPTTQKEDLGRTLRDVRSAPTKWDVYERWLRVPYYVIFNHRTNDELRIYALSKDRYEEVNHQGRLWIENAKLGLGLWEGSYLNHSRRWLRWYDGDGNWILTAAERLERERVLLEQERERAEQERERAEQERERAEQERGEKEDAWQRIQQLEARMRALGLNPDVG